MVVLAIETVTRAGSIAVADGAASRAAAGDAGRTHGARLPGEVLRALAAEGRALADVDLFAIIAGPGSFTGLRIGMAAAQGLTLAHGKTIVPVPTLEAMVLGWIGRAAPQRGTVVAACLDGHRREVFSAAWRVVNPGAFEMTERVLEPRVGAPDVLADELTSLAREAEVVVVGDGARRHASVFGALRIEDLPVTLAEVAARYAWHHPERAVAPHALRPIYIRRPDAVLARERAGAAARVPQA